MERNIGGIAIPTAWENPVNNSNVPKIAICVPYIGKWEPEWVDRTYGPLKYVPTNWCTKIIFLSKVQSLAVARDILVSQALQLDCDYVFFLDTDMVFEYPTDPNSALNILYRVINKEKSNKDGKIVSALYRAKQKTGFSYAIWQKASVSGFIPVQQWTGNWLDVDTAGLGCCLIDTTVFKDIERPWFRWELKDEISEDFYFYRLAKKSGYNLHVYTDVRLSHLGMLKVLSTGEIVTPEM